jgi:hypothetical protein
MDVASIAISTGCSRAPAVDSSPWDIQGWRIIIVFDARNALSKEDLRHVKWLSPRDKKKESMHSMVLPSRGFDTTKCKGSSVNKTKQCPLGLKF